MPYLGGCRSRQSSLESPGVSNTAGVGAINRRLASPKATSRISLEPKQAKNLYVGASLSRVVGAASSSGKPAGLGRCVWSQLPDLSCIPPPLVFSGTPRVIVSRRKTRQSFHSPSVSGKSFLAAALFPFRSRLTCLPLRSRTSSFSGTARRDSERGGVRGAMAP